MSELAGVASLGFVVSVVAAGVLPGGAPAGGLVTGFPGLELPAGCVGAAGAVEAGGSGVIDGVAEEPVGDEAVGALASPEVGASTAAAGFFAGRLNHANP